MTNFQTWLAGQADKVAKIAAEYNALTAHWGF